MRSRRTVLSAALLLPLLACQPQVRVVTDAVPVNGIGYVALNAPIFTSSGDLLIAAINRMVDAGATQIRLAINSPGGDIDVAQRIVEEMNRLNTQKGVRFEAYNVGMVASAASYVFLSAQRRYTNPRSAFLFHAAGLVASGAVSAERLREQADKIEAYERTLRGIMKSRTKLKDGEIDVYLRRTVLLSPDDARRDGVVDAIQAYPSTQDVTVAIIGARPGTTGVATPTPSGINNGGR